MTIYGEKEAAGGCDVYVGAFLLGRIFINDNSAKDIHTCIGFWS